MQVGNAIMSELTVTQQTLETVEKMAKVMKNLAPNLQKIHLRLLVESSKA